MNDHLACRRGWVFLLATIFFVMSVGTDLVADPEKTSDAGPPRFSLKFGGGGGWLMGRGDDLDLMRIRREVLCRSAFDWEPMEYAYEFPAELVIRLNHNLGIGFGSGLLTASTRGKYSWEYHIASFSYGSGYAEDNLIDAVRNFKIHVVPMQVNLYLFQSFGPLSIFSYGGVGYYIGSMRHSATVDYELKNEARWLYYIPWTHTKTEEYGTLLIEENLHKGSLGFQGGVGTELALFKGVSLGFEICSRHLVFAGWQGTSKTDSTVLLKSWNVNNGWLPDVSETKSIERKGTLWFSWTRDRVLDKDIDVLYVEDAEEPDSALFGPKREARIDLSAVGIRLSLYLHFGRSR